MALTNFSDLHKRTIITNALIKAKIFAILHTIRHCATNLCLTVFTDSQAAIDAIKKSASHITGRNLLKLSCHGILSTIYAITSTQNIMLTLVKIKGHSVSDNYLLDESHIETLLERDSMPLESYSTKLLKAAPYAAWAE
ncbi:hypothetical protein HK105_207276, partial [Polyrhizophydium stewartii]